jgi:hypothetical protein
MAKTTLETPAIQRSAMTPEQRAWLKQLGTLVGKRGGNGNGETAAAPAVPRATSAANKSALTEGIGVPVPGLGDIPGIVKDLLSNLSCKCKLVNHTDTVLRLDKSSIKIESGKFKTEPPAEIKAGHTGKFVAVNKFPNTAGVEGELVYLIDEKKTGWRIKWDNPRIGDNSSESEVKGPNKDDFDSDDDAGQGPEADFEYTLDPVGGPPPNPPNPPPNPQPDVLATCQITINNQTQLVLTLADQGHDRGDFVNLPATTIPAGGSVSFGSTQTPRGKEKGCKGFVAYEVGSPAAVIFRAEWDNPVGDKNTAKATAEPQTAGFRAVAQIGEGDENVPAVFTISGGSGGQTPVPPIPPVDPGEDDDKDVAPPGSRQPTLRKGDQSPDGWVEFLQVQLNHHLGLKLPVNGVFDATIEKTVRKFQSTRKPPLLVDGVVGNQTWAALREDTPEAPSTDGRQPHTFEEKGPQARFDNENVDGQYSTSKDELLLCVASVGEQPIDKFHIHIHVTPPDGPKVSKKFVIGPPEPNADVPNQPGGGAQHKVRIAKFKKIFLPKGSTALVSDCKIEAFFDSEIGSDIFRGKVQEVA